jgi:Sec-independent protein secretion pathway component TatC
MSEETETWTEWRKHVLLELERHSKLYETMTKDIQAIRADIILLKMKAGLWGALAGAIPVILMILIYLLREALTK